MHYRDREQNDILLPTFNYSKSNDIDQREIVSASANSIHHCQCNVKDKSAISTISSKPPPWIQPHESCLRSSHKLFVLKHIISTYLLSYEQYRIAPTSKALYTHICSESTYTQSMFIRDAMYWNECDHSKAASAPHPPIHLDFLDTLKSMDMSQLMQLKYIFIYLHKINKYITNTLADESLQIRVLQLSTFIKPQMLMSDRPHRDSVHDLDRFKYMCDILQYADFSSAHNTIQHIDLSDNSLNHEDLFRVLKSIQSNANCIQFTNVLTLDISHNLFIDDSCALFHHLLDTIGAKFPNLQTLNASHTSVSSSAVLDAMVEFHAQYPAHPLQMVNVKRCESWRISPEQVEQVTNLPITVLYDEASANDDDNEYFEFGFDCTLHYDTDTEDDALEPHETDTAADPIMKLSHACEDDTPSNIINYLHYQSRDAEADADDDDDSDGFVYL